MAKESNFVRRRSFLLVALCTVIISSVLLLSDVALGADSDQKARMEVAQEFIDVAQAKYEKGLYDSALKMLDQLQEEYKDVLVGKSATEVKQLIANIELAKKQSADAGKGLSESKKLIKDAKYSQAIALLNNIKKIPSISDSQRSDVDSLLAEAKKGNIALKSQMQELFKKSVKLYKSGDLEAALKGFKRVEGSGVAISSWGKDSAYYINEINSKLPNEQVEEAQVQDNQDKSNEVASDDASQKSQDTAAVAVKPVDEIKDSTQEQVSDSAQSKVAENSYIRVVEQKKARQRDYTRAVVNNAIAKAQNYASKEKYAKARSSLAIAYANIDKNRMLLGDSLYADYKSKLDQLSSSVEQGANQKAELDSKQQITETQQLQQQIRENMDRQREAAVKEYLKNSYAFQKEQRYKEALAQIEALLAIDPLNNTALIQKQSLEDIITWRNQNSIQKEKYEQEIKLLLETDKSTIPYVDEMTYPKNWKDLVGKRKSDQEMAVDPANYAVYRELDKEVDLSALTEETTFSEAIEMIKNSVSPALKIVVLWRDLSDNAYVEQDTPINVTMPGSVKISVALKLILGSVAGGFAELDYAIKDGIITVATVDALPNRMEIRQYSIAELLGKPANFITDMDTSEMGYSGDSGSSGVPTNNNDQQTSDDAETQTSQQVQDIITLIQDTVAPESWYDAGGEATIKQGPNQRLVVSQSPENHVKIAKLLKGLRSSLGQQIAIEARFLIVTENFIEQLGIDFDVSQNLGSKWGTWTLSQNSATNTTPGATGVPGSLGASGLLPSVLSGGYGSIFDDLQVSFLVHAVQSHRDATTLNAPKVTVLNGESATISVLTSKSYVSDFDFENITQAGDNQDTTIIADPTIDTLFDGVVLNVTPTITADKKYVLLNVTTSFTSTNFNKTYDMPASDTVSYKIELPESQIADVKTRVLVPDSGTLLIGGQKLSSDVNMDDGIPVLSKLPLIGRLFENRSQVKDSNILLILIKPTLMFYDELEENATGMTQ